LARLSARRRCSAAEVEVEVVGESDEAEEGRACSRKKDGEGGRTYSPVARPTR